MNTGEEKFAQTQPIAEQNDADRINRTETLSANDVDKLGQQAGIEMSDGEELGLKDKIDARDDSRLDLQWCWTSFSRVRQLAILLDGFIDYWNTTALLIESER